MEQNESHILEVRDLSVSYGNIVGIKGIDLNVQKGEIVTLIGANGAGKSTVLKGILGIQRASRGKVLFQGREITRESVDRIVSSGIVLVPEGRGIIAQMTVMENLELGAYHRKRDISASLEEVFEWFPILKERKDQVAGRFSGGQQQMLAIARAMMADPVLIMMDEPSLGLAPIIIKQLFEIIANMKDDGHTILLAEQNARKALQIADRGYAFEKGRIAIEGTKRNLVENELVHQAYLGG